MCEPEQASLMMGGLHPRGSLYERPINIDIAKVFLRALPLSGPHTASSSLYYSSLCTWTCRHSMQTFGPSFVSMACVC